MSTPVSQLPPTSAPPDNVRHDEDQIVADVISEMQHQYNPKPPSAQVQPPPPAPQVIQQYVLPQAPPSPQQYVHGQNHGQSQLLFGVINKDIAIRAVVAAVAAFAFFYPESLSSVYVKIPTVGAYLEPHDKIIRALFLAILFYILLWKLNI